MSSRFPHRSTVRRIRGRRLQAIRAAWFAEHPLCVRCLAKRPRVIRPAVVLDHIVALENGGPDFDVDEGKNRQGLCVECHGEKTAEDMGYRVRPEIGEDGWPHAAAGAA